MHFHLPKPLHGWREFAGEVGIIVIGVLIALGAEQMVEMIHTRTKVAEDTNAVRREIADHYTFAAEWRVIAPCISAQIDRLEHRIIQSGAKLGAAPVYHEDTFSYVLRAPSREYDNGAWQSALGDGAISSLATDMRQKLNSHYEQIREVNEITMSDLNDASKLTILGMPLPLDASSRLALIQQLEQLRGRNAYMDLIDGQLIDNINRLDMKPSMAQTNALLRASGTYGFCKAKGLPTRSLRDALVPIGYYGPNTPATRTTT